MKPRIVYSDRILNLMAKNKAANGTMLFPFVILRKNLQGAVEGEIIKQHEMIHFEQAKELFVIGFYLLYAFYFLKRLARGYTPYQAYRGICFEIEAFLFEDRKGYLHIRQKYIWRKL